MNLIIVSSTILLSALGNDDTSLGGEFWTKKMFVDSKACTGCRVCELICSVRHEKKIRPRKARLRIVSEYPPGIDMPMVCRQCGRAPCIVSCAVNALEREMKTGAVVVTDACVGCGVCMEACPFGAVTFDLDEKVPLICNLCRGEPVCVKYCPTGALKYSTPETYIASRGRALASKW